MFRSGLCDNIYTRTLPGDMEVSWHRAATSWLVNWLVLKLDGCSNLSFENSSLTSLTASHIQELFAEIAGWNRPRSLLGMCWRVCLHQRSHSSACEHSCVCLNVQRSSPHLHCAASSQTLLGPLDCCYSSSGTTAVSLHFRKTGLVKVAVFDPKETLSLHHLRGLCAVRPVLWIWGNKVTRKEPISKQAALTFLLQPTANHFPFNTLLSAASSSLKSQRGAHARTWNKGFGNVTQNEPSESKKPSEIERAAGPVKDTLRN